MLQMNKFVPFIILLNDVLSESFLLPILTQVFLFFDSEASTTYYLLSATYSIAQFFSSFIIGFFADKFGRRIVILCCILGSIVSISILTFTVLFNWSNAAIPLFLLFLTRLIDGLAGGITAITTTILADISNEKDRAATFGLIGVAFFPLIFNLTNIVLVNTNNKLIKSIMIASIIKIINFIFVFFFLEETNPKTTVTTKEILINTKTRYLLLAFFIYFVAFTGLNNILILFIKDSLNWTIKASSGTLVVISVISTIVQGFLIKSLVKKFGEKNLVLTGCGMILLSCIRLILTPKENTVINVYLAVSFLAVGDGLITPCLRAIISKKTNERKQGSILSILQGLQSLGGVLGIGIAATVYDVFGPKAPFIFGSFLIFLMLYFVAVETNNSAAEKVIRAV